MKLIELIKNFFNQEFSYNSADERIVLTVSRRELEVLREILRPLVLEHLKKNENQNKEIT